VAACRIAKSRTTRLGPDGGDACAVQEGAPVAGGFVREQDRQRWVRVVEPAVVVELPDRLPEGVPALGALGFD
jgi:hypothetical protein